MKDTTNEIANGGNANGDYRRSLTPGGKLLLQKLRKAATQIETALKEMELALIKLDAAWDIHRALRESRSVRHEEADEAERSIPRCVNSIDDSMTLLSFAVEDALKATAAYPIEGGDFRVLRYLP